MVIDTIDVSRTAAEARISYPLHLSVGVWDDCVKWPRGENARRNTLQDEAGRLWDVVWMTSRAVGWIGVGDREPVELYQVPLVGDGVEAELVKLVAVCTRTEDGPVITVTLPHEVDEVE